MPADTINRQLRGSFYRRNRLAFALAGAEGGLPAAAALALGIGVQNLPEGAVRTLSGIRSGFVHTSGRYLRSYALILLITFAELALGLTIIGAQRPIAAALGICAGSVMGMWHGAYDLLHPFITAVRQIPVIAWIPLIILWYGIGETSKVVVIAIAAFFPITLNTLGGFQSLPSGYLEVARLYRLGVSETFRKVYLPNALPQILVGLKLGLGSSWMAVVAAELIAANSGIGYRLSYSRGSCACS